MGEETGTSAAAHSEAPIEEESEAIETSHPTSSYRHKTKTDPTQPKARHGKGRVGCPWPPWQLRRQRKRGGPFFKGAAVKIPLGVMCLGVLTGELRHLP